MRWLVSATLKVISKHLKSLVKYLKEFFEPQFCEYEINLPVKNVLDKLTQVFNEFSSNSGMKELVGSIEGEEFTMGIIGGGNEALYSAALRGKVIAKRTESSRLEIYIVRNSSTYLTFFLSIFASLLYLMLYFSNPTSNDPLIGSLAALTLGSTFSIWFSNYSSQSVKKKFETFLEKHNLFRENCG